jgi:hypothetical protein
MAVITRTTAAEVNTNRTANSVVARIAKFFLALIAIALTIVIAIFVFATFGR